MTNDADRVRDIVGQMRVCADCARSSPDEFTYLNSAARPMLKKAANVIEAQSKALAEARAEIAETKRILEGCLAVAVKGDPLDAPFPMEPHQAVIWHQARTEAFRHALEMMPSTPTPENPNG